MTVIRRLIYSCLMVVLNFINLIAKQHVLFDLERKQFFCVLNIQTTWLNIRKRIYFGLNFNIFKLNASKAFSFLIILKSNIIFIVRLVLIKISIRSLFTPKKFVHKKYKFNLKSQSLWKLKKKKSLIRSECFFFFLIYSLYGNKFC